ncbi:type II toxin-antitoxin system Phd/YefM family antitoxin [Nocardia noduli]|uniref:type II toxin-antitoxin system Phd/YefM family antitoxin n=1 Tax=Nocardia noduli TaxID=2815722 RepID=UPI001C243EA8|nr:type II toxin-antitoxin system prevent-host-death family antitoxin [Nocardia noduli]
MRAMHSTEARQNWSEVLDAATEDNDEVVITRSGGKEPAVVISLAAYNSLKETAHILSTRANSRRLLESIANLESGRVEAHELIEPEDNDE